MQKTVKVIILTVFSTLLSNSVMAFDADWLFSGAKPYVGVDAQIRRMDYKGGFGDNLLQHHSPQGNVYVGMKFKDMVGLEVGYEATETRSRTIKAYTGDVINGFPLPAVNSPAVYNSKQKIVGPHIDLMGYYSFCDVVPFELIGGVGASIVKGSFKRTLVSSRGVFMGTEREFVTHKVLARINAGLHYYLSESSALRFNVTWVNTSRMVIGTKDATGPQVKPKNSFVYGIGGVITF